MTCNAKDLAAGIREMRSVAGRLIFQYRFCVGWRFRKAEEFQHVWIFNKSSFLIQRSRKLLHFVLYRFFLSGRQQSFIVLCTDVSLKRAYAHCTQNEKNGKNQILIRRNRQIFSLQKAGLYGMIQVRNKAYDRRKKKAADETR